MLLRCLTLAAVAALLIASPGMAEDGSWVEPRPGCKVLVDVRMVGGADASWAGGCRDGFAAGYGTVQYTYKGRAAGWFSGTVVAGKYEGKGIRSYPDGGRYDGAWRDSKRNGQGVQTWPNGRSYAGGWKDDKASGTGTATDETGATWTGTWLSGCLRRSPGQLRPPISVGANDCPRGY